MRGLCFIIPCTLIQRYVPRQQHHRTISPMRASHCLTHRSVLVRALAAVPVCLALAASFAAQAQTYTITDLGTLGGSFSVALGVNSRGQVIGNSFTTGDQALHAFIYSDGRMRDLGTLGGSSSSADARSEERRVGKEGR